MPRDLTITVTGLGSERRTCPADPDLYVPAGVDGQLTLVAELYDIGPDGASSCRTARSARSGWATCGSR